MSDIGKAIDRCISLSLAPLLKKESFKKSGRTFLRKQAHWIHVVNVQANRWNAGASGSFTVNLGIYFPEVVQAIGWTQTTPSPPKGMCTISHRLCVTPDETDHWWKIHPESDLEEISGAIRAAWIQFGKPWLERYSVLTEAVRFKGAVPLVRAGILYLLDRREEAGAVIRNELGFVSAANSLYKAPLFVWARAQGSQR
jgi:hypothetical protein